MNLIEKTKAEVKWGNFSLFKNPDGETAGSSYDIWTIVTNVIDLILWVAAIIAIIYLIYSGILYLTAAGNPDSAKKGQQGIINAVIGIVIISLVWVIARAISGFANTITI